MSHDSVLICAQSNIRTMNEFHSRLIQRYANVDVFVKCYFDVLSASKDGIYTWYCQSLHWMDNFDKKSFKSTLKETKHFIPESEFINNCSNDLDVSVFSLNRWFRYLRTLKIKSHGPISTNKNVSFTISIIIKKIEHLFDFFYRFIAGIRIVWPLRI